MHIHLPSVTLFAENRLMTDYKSARRTHARTHVYKDTLDDSEFLTGNKWHEIPEGVMVLSGMVFPYV